MLMHSLFLIVASVVPSGRVETSSSKYFNKYSELTKSKVACRVTFMPAINRGCPYGTAIEVDDWKPEPSVFRRLVDNAIMVMEKKQKKEQLSHRPFDTRTGRELFKPLIGRKPYNVSYFSKTPVLFQLDDVLKN